MDTQSNFSDWCEGGLRRKKVDLAPGNDTTHNYADALKDVVTTVTNNLRIGIIVMVCMIRLWKNFTCFTLRDYW